MSAVGERPGLRAALATVRAEAIGIHPGSQAALAATPVLDALDLDLAVIQDLDNDGYEQTGWNVLYMHVEIRDRIQPNTFVYAGERIGHPSCEGGFSTSTHLHIARTYNGRWIAADGPLAFEMSGWVSQGLGLEYDGLLVRDDVVKEACECREEGNTITRE